MNLKKAIGFIFLLTFVALISSCGGGGLSNNATITSNIYTVSVGGTALETITAVPDRTSKETFLAGLIKGDVGQAWDSTNISDPVITGDLLVVTAADLQTTVTYAVTVVGYALRDTGPAGGLIFYINTNYATDGWKYLEAAPSATDTSALAWSSAIGDLLVGTQTAIGTGLDNTVAVVDALAEEGEAAEYCSLLIVNDYSDWFLPSLNELNLMYTNLYSAGVGDFTHNINTYYWSSSEEDDGNAWFIDFGDGAGSGDQAFTGKNFDLANYRVRAARAF